MALLTPEDIRAQLPKVGDRLMKKPGYYHGFLSKSDGMTPKPCVVTYVHPEHNWYTVQFESGVQQAYKLPELRIGMYGGLLG